MKDEIEITEAMIQAGLAELYGSGAVDDYQEVDRRTVAEIFRAMYCAAQPQNQDQVAQPDK